MERSPPRLSGEDPDFEPIRGSKCFVRGCNGANQSLIDTMGSVPGGPQGRKISARFFSYLEQLADGGQLRSPQRFNKEGELPGHQTGHFFAVKLKKSTVNIRAYVFLFNGDWWISHFTNKKKNKLSSKDIERVETNYRLLAGNN